MKFFTDKEEIYFLIIVCFGYFIGLALNLLGYPTFKEYTINPVFGTVLMGTSYYLFLYFQKLDDLLKYKKFIVHSLIIGLLFMLIINFSDLFLYFNVTIKYLNVGIGVMMGFSFMYIVKKTQSKWIFLQKKLKRYYYLLYHIPFYLHYSFIIYLIGSK